MSYLVMFILIIVGLISEWLHISWIKSLIEVSVVILVCGYIGNLLNDIYHYVSKLSKDIHQIKHLLQDKLDPEKEIFIEDCD